MPHIDTTFRYEAQHCSLSRHFKPKLNELNEWLLNVTALTVSQHKNCRCVTLTVPRMQNAKTLCCPTQTQIAGGWKARWKVWKFKVTSNLNKLNWASTVFALVLHHYQGLRVKVQRSVSQYNLTLNFLMAWISGCCVWMFVVYFFFLYLLTDVCR